MLSINSNISSLVAQENLTGSGTALSQAITRLSSGKRINSAADDAAGLAISTTLQTQINGLNQGVANANDGTSIVQTASSALSQITQSLQTIRSLAVEASNGSLSTSDQAALQQEVSQQIGEVNRISSQTTYNGVSLLNGTAGSINFQIGANTGQTMTLDLGTDMSAANLGGAHPASGTTLGTLSGLAIDGSTGGAYGSSSTSEITSVNVIADGNGGFTFTDQNNQTIGGGAISGMFGASTFTQAAGVTASASLPSFASLSSGAGFSAMGSAALSTINTELTQISADSAPPLVSNIDISTTTGASAAMESIDNALATVNNLQATLGAAQNRFAALVSTQQSASTNLASAQSQITDADFAQETANLSKAQVLQQAGISVLAQANSLPQQVLKLLQG
ncbi:flagellin [Paraburkholderia phosphatilytica]|uniref:flagellin n=1 Tax=Paraburkholderia phosphatilytica TaxID=2282883 RepID=UPI000E52B51C|nr:flagellin [Paraburkholderia phosphatilytica]